MHRFDTTKRLVAMAGAVVFGLTGCSAGPELSDMAADSNFPVTIAAGNGDVTVPSRPERVVSLSPTATEMLFAIGAGPQVVAVDDQSTFPAEAPKTDLSGFTPNAEAIAGYNPDLVVISNDMNGLVGSLEALDIPVLLEPAATTLDDVYEQTRELGQATGNEPDANELALKMKSDIDRLIADAKPEDNGLSVYHEVDDTLYSATSQTFLGQIYDRFGYENVADAADTTNSGYPQLSAEYLVKADPDVIFLADTKCCGQSPATVAERPGFSGLTAVRNDNVIPLDDDVASRWGPRVVDLVRTIAESTTEAQAEAA